MAKPKRKPGESMRAYRARVAKWEAQQVGDAAKNVVKTVGRGVKALGRLAFPERRGTLTRADLRMDRQPQYRQNSRSTDKQGPPAPIRKVKYPVQEVKSETKQEKPPTPQNPAPQQKPKPQTTKQVKESGKDPMHVWARANRKMIERSGTKKQRAILAEALKVKKKKKEKMSGTTGGYSKNVA